MWAVWSVRQKPRLSTLMPPAASSPQVVMRVVWWVIFILEPQLPMLTQREALMGEVQTLSAVSWVMVAVVALSPTSMPPVRLLPADLIRGAW